MNAVGIKGVRISASIQVVLATLVVILDLLLIPIMGINGAIISLIIAHFISILIINLYKGIL
jgi:Na+-driven multidrug efflux pump